MKKIITFLIIGLVLIACSDDNGDGGDQTSDNFDRVALLTNWADNIIIPAYADFNAKLNDLQTSFNTFENETTQENLVALRAEWLTSYKVWQRVSMFEIGPAEQVGLRLNINSYPASVTKIGDNITSGSANLSLPSNRDAKGFPAIDYLLNGLASTDGEIVQIYSGNSEGEAHLDYLKLVIQDMTSLSNSVASSWTNDYRDTFVNNSGSSATASVDRFVNDFIFYYEKFLRAGKMGIPLGVFTGTPAPNTIEAFHKADDVSNELFLVGLQASIDFFNGKHYNSTTRGESLKSYLDELNTVKNGADLSAAINTQLETAKTAVSALGAFRTEIETNNPPTQMLNAYQQVQAAVPLFKVDMVSAMSISIDFVDADGD
ncbi:imelysin family protein [Spongiivirga sp. MCCC 1A20706]|uniref:imelysin family protein n=1 Tax=Spongiivirga sp. MCCC 1A20706 TaxID=3160963 RepID=UPI0039773937